MSKTLPSNNHGSLIKSNCLSSPGETEVTQVYQQLEDVLQGPEQDVQSTANDSFHQDGDIAISSGHGQEIGLHLWLNKTVYYTYAETLSKAIMLIIMS